jgi:NCAIR mutase (PurE)-related protein
MADITFDFQRRERIGLSEAVLCTGKSAAQIGEAIALAKGRKTSLLLTRLTPEMVSELTPAELAALDYDPHSRTAILGEVPAASGEPPVAVVTAGTSDLPVAREAIRTLAFYGVAAREIADVGVAGLWRILRHEEELRRYPVVIVVAGMEGALFSVVTGLVGGVVIAVPTSTGYGAARAGETALHAALASCAPGLVAVNIDNGYGAASAALRVLACRGHRAGAGARSGQASGARD